MDKIRIIKQLENELKEVKSRLNAIVSHASESTINFYQGQIASLTFALEVVKNV